VRPRLYDDKKTKGSAEISGAWLLRLFAPGYRIHEIGRANPKPTRTGRVVAREGMSHPNSMNMTRRAEQLQGKEAILAMWESQSKDVQVANAEYIKELKAEITRIKNYILHRKEGPDWLDERNQLSPSAR
jgi:hypothetical protein